MKILHRLSNPLFISVLILFVSYGYFFAYPGWNQSSRFALARSIVTHGVVNIDAYHKSTGDKARFKGHYYSDKAPGASLMVTPILLITKQVLTYIGMKSDSGKGLDISLYVITLLSCGLFTICAACCLYYISLQLGATENGALFSVLAFGLATPAWIYSTLLFSHAIAMGLLMLLFTATIKVETIKSKHTPLFMVVLGLFSGFAFIVEFTTLPPIFFLVAYAFYRLKLTSLLQYMKISTFFFIGLFPPLILFFLYNHLAFNHILTIGYSHLKSFPGMEKGLFGLTYPKLSILKELLIGSYRGLLPLAPLLIMSPIGTYFLVRSQSTRAIALISMGIGLYFILLNSSYFYWDGGDAYGPRHLLPGLVFLCVPLASLWSNARLFQRNLLSCLFFIGLVMSLATVSTAPMPPDSWGHDTIAEIITLFINGRFNNVTNLGQILGLQKISSLFPLLLFWMFGFLWLARTIEGQYACKK